MDELIPVNIVIADRTYRIKVMRSQEEMIRKTVKLVNDKIIEYKTHLAGRDMQDYVSMALIWFATEQNKHQGNLTVMNEISDALNAMEKVIDKALNE